MTKEDVYRMLKDYSAWNDFAAKYLLVTALLQQSCDIIKYNKAEFKAEAFEKLCIGVEVLQELNKKYLVKNNAEK